jgi:hypothetical protein
MQKPYASKCGQERPSSCVKKLFSKEALKCRNIKYLNAGRNCIKMQKQHTEKKKHFNFFFFWVHFMPKNKLVLPTLFSGSEKIKRK